MAMALLFFLASADRQGVYPATLDLIGDDVDVVEGTQTWLLQTKIEVSARASATQPVNSSANASANQPVTATTATTTGLLLAPNASAAEYSGVSMNAAGDLSAFIVALIIFPGAVFFMILTFLFLAKRYPVMYQNNVIAGFAPSSSVKFQGGGGAWGWAKAALSTTTEQYIKSVGLDQAMLMFYCEVAMRILIWVGVPMMFLFGPMNLIWGGFAAGPDHLSYFSFGNVANGKWHYWVYSVVVWYVVWVVQHHVFQAMAVFVKHRYQWLRNLPEPRPMTVLVENIPEKFCSDAKLKALFETTFGSGSVEAAHVVKETSELLALEKEQDAEEKKLEEHRALVRNGLGAAMTNEEQQEHQATEVNLLNNFRDLSERVETLRLEVLDKAEKEVTGVNLTNGFVQFTSRKNAIASASIQFGESYDSMVISAPPPPSSIIWGDLKRDATRNAGWALIGYGLMVGLFLLYMPLTVWVTQLAQLVNMGPFQPLWAGVAPTMGLQFMIAFLPTFIIWIFRLSVPIKDDAWCQFKLARYYFFFQVVFVVLVTAISSDVEHFVVAVFNDPSHVPIILGTTMPYATHFYMNFMVLQWLSHGMNLTRYIQLCKFKLFHALYPIETAREMAEPEDQDYYGIGSRTSRFSTNMLICLIYGTLCPWMSLLGYVNFFICRVFYGYLIAFAENKKPDLGGMFFVQKLRNLFIGCIIYVVMMSGVLLARSNSNGPCIISIISLIYVIARWRRFEVEFVWETLPIEQGVLHGFTAAKASAEAAKAASQSQKEPEYFEGYVQPELVDPQMRERHLRSSPFKALKALARRD